MNGCVDGWTLDRKKWVADTVNGSMRGYAVGWTGDWVSGYMGGRMGKWVSGCVCRRMDG